ncbi:MAG: polysaccharide biosynthesis protein, partial [Gammaproteobacteria bacterium]
MIQLSNKRLVAFLHDVIMIPIAWLGAYWLRFNLDVVPEQYLTPGLYLLPFVIIIQSGFFWYFGLYRGVWRYASIPDLMRIGKAVFFAALTGLLIYIWIHIPRSILPLYSILLVALLSGPRLLFRWFKDHKLAYKPGQRVLIAGAGHAGEQLIRDLLRAPDGDYLPVAFIDDDPDKKGREIHGIRILGTIDQLPKLVPELAIELVLIAIPSANHHEMKRLVEYCEQANVMFKTLPTTVDVISGKVSINDLREVSIEDL